MAESITGKKVAFVSADGVEPSELSQPWEAVKAAGGQPVLISQKTGTITAKDKGEGSPETFDVDLAISDAKAQDYDALVLPGGTVASDKLRTNEDVISFVRDFFTAHKPVAAICHAPWLLIEAEVVKGRRMTSVKAVATDLKNAGAQWVDEEVVVDNGLTTSRTPDDLDAFCAKVVEEIAEGKHSGQTA